ncbi:hypothetical protein ACNFIC_06650 [Pseudomonas sp. NY15463]|uniref:hypothetical protein n=1 Tax=Pseudomonas sp. NY15463 TaxID=3400361 RepID=UPI003A8C7D8F
MSDTIYLKWLRGRLTCELGGAVWPVCFNRKGYLEVMRQAVEPELFYIGMLKHPAIGGEIAFEFRTADGQQVTGGEHAGLTASRELLPTPGPALRIFSKGEVGPDFPNQHYVKLQSLDSRWVAVSGRRKVDRDWQWFAINPTREVPISIAEREAGILRLLEPHFAGATTFTLELIDSDEDEAPET